MGMCWSANYVPNSSAWFHEMTASIPAAKVFNVSHVRGIWRLYAW
jgi:hypothetical protein